jgi:ParB/RepB/Spo0J family partition protein
MRMNELPFNPLDVRARINPSFPATPAPFDAWSHIGETVWLDPRRVKFMKGQPRERMTNIKELAEEIREDGQKTTILVHPIDDSEYDVELTAGERRTRACREGGIMIRAEVRPPPACEREHFIDAVVENFNREDLSILETVRAIDRLVNQYGLTQSEVAVKLGKTDGWVSNRSICVS